MNTIPDERITSPAYIVLELPSPVADKVRDFRSRFDSDRALMPAEITLTGSCGTGIISPGQSYSSVRTFVNAAARAVEPFPAKFKGIGRFPGTDIYFLTLEDPTPFQRAHEIFSKCGLSFEPNSYPYQPHCTLKLRRPPEDMEELIDLFTLHVPQETFMLDTVSVYMLQDADNCELVHRAPLGNRAL